MRGQQIGATPATSDQGVRKASKQNRKQSYNGKYTSDFDDTLLESIYLDHEETFWRGPEAVRGQNERQMMDFR